MTRKTETSRLKKVRSGAIVKRKQPRIKHSRLPNNGKMISPPRTKLIP